MKKIITSVFLLVSSVLHAATLIIDDFSYSQATSSGSSGGTKSEASDASIFGGYRSILANGYATFIFVDNHFQAGDSSGLSSISISEGTMNLSKSAFTGSAFATYEGRAFTSGDRIGDLSLDISGGESSLASPILWLEYTASISDQVISLSLSSAIDTFSSYDIPLFARTSEFMVDLTKFTAVGNGVLGRVDFSNVEDILIGFGAGDPVGEIQLKTFAFVPEPASRVLIGSGLLVLLSRRRRNQEFEQAAT